MQLAHITINEASALSSRHGKPCNPFCVILFNQGERRETEKRKNEGNPKWNFTFPCSLNLASAVPVIDVQVFSDKELLGQVSFFLRCPLPKGPQWYPLGTLPGANDQVTQGRLRLSITVPWEKQITFVPSLVPMHQGMQYIRGVSSKSDGKIEFVVIQFDDYLYGFRTLSPISTATPLFAVPIINIISIMPHEDSDCIALAITFTSQNSTENETVSIKCSSMSAFQYFSVLLQLWRKRLLTTKKMQLPLSLQSYNNPPASNPFSDFTSNNFHMQVPEEFEFVKSQKKKPKPIVFQQESTASPSTKSIPSSFLFSYDNLINERSFISTVTALNNDTFSSISKYKGKFSTLEINKETINRNKNTRKGRAVGSSKRTPTQFSANGEGNLNTIVFSGEDKAPFRCGLPQMNDEYVIQQLVKLYQRKQGGEKETIVVYSNQTVTYRGMNLPQNDLYEMALLCPPPPSVELFGPFGVGDDSYDCLLPWDDEYLEKHPPPAMLPLKELFLSVGFDPSRSFSLRKPSTFFIPKAAKAFMQARQPATNATSIQQKQQQSEKKNDIVGSPTKPKHLETSLKHPRGSRLPPPKPQNQNQNQNPNPNPNPNPNLNPNPNPNPPQVKHTPRPPSVPHPSLAQKQNTVHSPANSHNTFSHPPQVAPSEVIAREQINNQLASITEKINLMKKNLQKKQQETHN